MSDGRFVIHTHRTEKLHYDLRIEIGGVLHSWAFSKGVSTDSAVRRMGIKIENQSLDYLEFEGMLNEQKYGQGKVIIWDTGEFRNIRMENEDNLDLRSSLEDGHLKLFLEGKKLTGGYTLIDVPYGKTKWLQVKEADDYVDKANDIFDNYPDSVVSDQ